MSTTSFQDEGVRQSLFGIEEDEHDDQEDEMMIRMAFLPPPFTPTTIPINTNNINPNIFTSSNTSLQSNSKPFNNNYYAITTTSTSSLPPQTLLSSLTSTTTSTINHPWASSSLSSWGSELGRECLVRSIKRRSSVNDDDDREGHTAMKMKRSVSMKGRRKVREPRFCFKTMSDVDVLDDGYKWRKYGQKVVKNTLHPRSYYRCTEEKCRVKKRVERLAEDPRMVITTYEGRHAHSPNNSNPNNDVEDDHLSSLISHHHILTNFFS